MKKFFLCLTFFALCGGVFLFGVGQVSAEGVIWHSGNYHITTSTVWRSGEVHALWDNSTLWVDQGVTLVIEPGAVFKVGYNSIVRINGNLYASGTPDEMIKIISLRDDSVAGDTNGDGVSTTPNFGDWRGIQFDGTRYNSIVNGLMNYVTVKGGGGSSGLKGTLIFASKANSLKIDNCDLSDNMGAIAIDGQSNNVSINHSDIYNPNYCDYSNETDECHYNSGMMIYSNKSVDVTNNFWGSSDGPTYTTGTDPTIFKGVVIFSVYNKANYLPFAREPFFGKRKINPVILIPGILGSWQIKGEWTIDPILHTYDDLLQAMRLAGYKDGETLFTFPYQWRDSNVSNTPLLMQKIEEVKTITGSDKVDLIGHSMGGLLARSYIESSYYKDDVDKLIFLATPHRGSPSSYLTWEAGEIGRGGYEFLQKNIFELEGLENGYGDIYTYIKNRPIRSIQELLPIYEYLKEASTSGIRIYPNNYPQNIFLELLNRPDNLAKLDNVKMLNIIANNDQDDTVNYVRVENKKFNDGKWINGYPEGYGDFLGDHGLELDAGDGTVPWFSNYEFSANEININNTDHRHVVSDAQKEVIKFLTGKEPEEFVKISQVDKLLLIRIFSPADFVITAPDGKRLGRGEANQDINEISSAFYFNEGVIEFAVIPNPLGGQYKIGLTGTANGGYRLSASYINNGKNQEMNFGGVIAQGQSQQINFNYLSDGEGLTTLQKDGITINSALADVDQIYKLKWLKLKADRLIIDLAYNGLRLGLNIIDSQLAKVKQVKMQSILKAQRTALINGTLNKLNDYITRLQSKNLLNQSGYDIIKNNNDYLKINL